MAGRLAEQPAMGWVHSRKRPPGTRKLLCNLPKCQYFALEREMADAQRSVGTCLCCSLIDVNGMGSKPQAPPKDGLVRSIRGPTHNGVQWLRKLNCEGKCRHKVMFGWDLIDAVAAALRR
jgi:hypothetical protein